MDSNAKRLMRQLGIAYVHALRLVRQAQQLAKQDKISYREAEQRVVRRLGSGAPGALTFAEALRDAVDAACQVLAYQDVSRPAPAGIAWGGLPFDDVDLPHHTLDTIGVELVEPDLDTVVWSVAEVFDGGMQAGTVEVLANVQFDGYAAKGAALPPDVVVARFDWNTHMSRVVFSRSLTLRFNAIAEPNLPGLSSMDFLGASDSDR